MIFQPILFGLIGTEIRVNDLDPNTVSLGIGVLIIGLSFRLVASYLAVLGGDLNLKERIFVALAWLPKGSYFMASSKIIFDKIVKRNPLLLEANHLELWGTTFLPH